MKQLETLLEKAQSELDAYVDILYKWQKAVNLVAASTLKDIWHRHILDSAQLYPLIPTTAETLIDMGSGAGFPGLVLAILNKKNQGHLKQIILIESDTKKCLFLKEVARQLSLSVQILNQRIETVQQMPTDILTARALAPVTTLLELGKSFITPQTTCLFLKGASVAKEVQNCPVPCQIDFIKSITNSNSSVLKITEVHYD